MTISGGVGHTLPYLISHFFTATAIAAVVVVVELLVRVEATVPCGQMYPDTNRGGVGAALSIDKRREAHHFYRMAFGNYKIKADFGGERITDRNFATAFMLTLTAIYRNKPHWKLADQALRQAFKSAAAESRASAAFKAAIEAEGWLEN